MCHVQIGVLCRAHDNVIAAFDRLDPGTLACPAEQQRAIADTAILAARGLFPGGGSFAQAHHLASQTFHHPALQIIGGFQPVFGTQLRSCGRTGPGVAGQLITAQMHVFKWKYLRQLRDDGFCHLPCLVHRRVDRVLRIALHGMFRTVVGRVAQAVNRGVDGQGMGRKLDLWHDVDVQPARVADQFLDKLLRIAAARLDAAPEQARQHVSFTAQPGFLPKIRQGFQLQAKRLIIGEMPVKAVHLHQRHQVQIGNQRVRLKEMPRAIQMHPAPAKGRPVADFRKWNIAAMRAQQMQQADRPVKHAPGVTCLQMHRVFPYGNLMMFRRHRGISFRVHGQAAVAQEGPQPVATGQTIYRLKFWVIAGKACNRDCFGVGSTAFWRRAEA